MRILISGIGRSGTTALYEAVGQVMKHTYSAVRCVYEPYLWNIPEIEKTCIAYGQPFNMEQVSPFNIFVHCNTPLFTDGSHPLHDKWMDMIFKVGGGISSKNIMAKEIRGAGRLEAFLNRYDDMKVIISTRNPYDTINSGLGIFSFFGDEFHPSDKPRFLREIKQRFNTDHAVQEINDEMDWSLLWWRYMTEASLDTYKKYTDRVIFLPYEAYAKDKRDAIESIARFCGLETDGFDFSVLDKAAGSRTKVSYLNKSMLDRAYGYMEWYIQNVNSLFGDNTITNSDHLDIISKYSNLPYEPSMLITHKTNYSAISWRIFYKNLNNKGKDKTGAQGQANRQNLTYSLANSIADFGDNSEQLLSARRAPGVRYIKHKSLAVIITSYNNVDTIAESVYSVLSQSKKPDAVIIADDGSSDGSQEILKWLEKKYPNVKLMLRPQNVGVAANRDLAIRDADADFIATLDGDDLYLPGKLELEYHCLDGRLDCVAFSDIAKVDNNSEILQSTREYSGIDKAKAINMLTARSAPVPRDMLFSKELFVQAGGFDVGLDIYEDWALKMRLLVYAADHGWIWSGGVGTVYNRRTAGLSKKPNVFHAHGQLVALSRNAKLLELYPHALLSGVETACKFMLEEQRKRYQGMLEHYRSSNNVTQLADRLEQFWKSCYIGSNAKRRHDDINTLQL